MKTHFFLLSLQIEYTKGIIIGYNNKNDIQL